MPFLWLRDQVSKQRTSQINALYIGHFLILRIYLTGFPLQVHQPLKDTSGSPSLLDSDLEEELCGFWASYCRMFFRHQLRFAA